MMIGKVEMDYDDICQRLRIKAWKGMEAYDARREVKAKGVDRFVFQCIMNEKKDLLKRAKRNESFIEDIAPEGDEGYEDHNVTRFEFEARYLMEGHEQAFRVVEEELPLIPSTLSKLERQVVHFLYLDYGYAEISAMLQIPRKEVAPLVRGIREKMADWSPSASPEDASELRQPEDETTSPEPIAA